MWSWLRDLATRGQAWLRGWLPPEVTPPPDAAPTASAGVGGAARNPRRRLLAWIVLLRTRAFVNVALAGAALFGALAWLVGAGQTATVDLALSQGLQSLQLPGLAALMTAVSEPGFAPLSFVLVGVATVGLLSLGRPIEAAGVVAGAGAALLAQPFKLAMARPRPTADMLMVTRELSDASFPSGHTLFYVGFFGFLFYLAYSRMPPSRQRTLLLWTLGALIVLIGPSRVYLGQHWASDVLASYALGLAYLAVLVRAYLARVARSSVPVPVTA